MVSIAQVWMAKWRLNRFQVRNSPDGLITPLFSAAERYTTPHLIFLDPPLREHKLKDPLLFNPNNFYSYKPP